MSFLLSLFAGSNSIFAALAGALFLGIGSWVHGRLSGANAERAKQTAGKLAAAQDRLEMDREATAAERAAAGMTDASARAEAKKWVRR
ncbi:hypothetical protein [Mesorhizobium sp. M0895]|uniref:hypothetical protein n=1 Tax=Mesorhizobium sp. M0895 TaxID=2957019 RepID=UPI0033378FC0